MFKLKKILNKHNNAPEIEILHLINDCVGQRECIYFVNYGELSPYDDESQEGHIYYLIYDDVEELDYDNRYVKCARITPNMFFEVKLNASYVKVGDKFALQKSNSLAGFDGISLVQTDGEHTDGYVCDVSNLQTRGTVLVRFHCIE